VSENWKNRRRHHRNRQRKPRYPTRPLSHPKPTLGITSLRIWLLLFIVVVGIIAFAENGNPSQFYQSIPDFVKYALYIFALWVSILMGYRVFEKCDINTYSDRGLFKMRLLSAGIGVIGIALVVYSYLWSFVGLFFGASLFRDVVSLFGVFLGIALLLVSAYLLFKFERRAGIIVFRH